MTHKPCESLQYKTLNSEGYGRRYGNVTIVTTTTHNPALTELFSRGRKQ